MMLPPPSLEINHQDHEYYLGERKLDPVTRVLDAVLKTGSPFWKAQDRLRGEFVHQITLAIDERAWDREQTVFPASWSQEDISKVTLRADAYQSFLDESGFVALAAELPVYSELFGIAGTLDRYGIFTKGAHQGKKMVGDIKTGKPTPAAELQVALYGTLLEQTFPDLPALDGLFVLHTRADGKPRPVYYTGTDKMVATSTAVAVVRVFHFMRDRGLLK